MDSGNFTMGPEMDAEEAVIQVSISLVMIIINILYFRYIIVR